MVIKTEMAEKHSSTKDHSSGVGLILALDIQADVTATRLENGNLTTHVAARDNTGATNESSTNVGQDTTVQVRHDHDIELLRARDSLHRGVVDNHVVDLESRVVLSGGVESASEETVSQLHDVGLVDAGNLGATISKGESKGELGNTLGLGAGDDLQTLNDAINALVLKARVFTLGVLTDDAKVDVLVSGAVAGDVLDKGNTGVDVELLSHGDVETLVAGSGDGSMQDTLETKLVPLQGGNTLAECLLSATSGRILDTGDVDLLPLNGDIVGLEEGLDRFGNLCTDTITGDEGDGVLASKLRGLEDVGLDGCEGSGEGKSGRASSGAKGLAIRTMHQY